MTYTVELAENGVFTDLYNVECDVKNPSVENSRGKVKPIYPTVQEPVIPAN